MIHQHRTSAVRRAFTLIEMLVVLLIIGLLAAILFPVLNQARESAYQASCASNLQQIYLAVELYRRDVEEYPPSLKALLSDTVELADGTLNTNGKGYFKGGKDALVCADDDTEAPSVGIRSSYGNVGAPNTADFGNYVWNYWGYRVDKGTNCDADNVSECLGTAYAQSEVVGYPNPSDPDPETYINSDYATILEGYPAFQISGTPDLDITRLPRLSNRFAPPTTIITHCVFHRLPTSNVAGAYDLYADATASQGAKDIVLRLDGTAKVVDVSGANFTDATKPSWALQRF